MLTVETVQTESGLVIGTLEFSEEYDLWYTRSIHSPPQHVKLMHDHDQAVRWVRDQHAYHTEQGALQSPEGAK